jgi:GNAT superfamily N-acetyltransferase
MFRSATESDTEALAALFARDEEYTLGRPSKLTPSDLRAWMSSVDYANNTWVAEQDGRPVATGWLYRRGDLGNGVGVIDPEARGRGLGSALVERIERRALETGAQRLQYDVLAGDKGAPRLLEGRGFRPVRGFFEMAIELDGPPPEPVLPDGYTIEPFREEDARAFHGTLEEAFRDHWEHHPREFEEWWEEKRTQPDYDPTFWYVVRAADGEIAAAARNYPNRNGGSWVDALGVRRAHRGRGLAKALLHRMFGESYARGMSRISLGVDAQNQTGATKLYESVGMTSELEMLTYEKSLA